MTIIIGYRAKDVDDNDKSAKNHHADASGARIPPILKSRLLPGKFKDFDMV